MLADFGVARWAGQHSDLTGTEATVGTVTYASPEQLTGQEIDGRADQYALAATAYHLMTGSAPFTNSNPAVVIGQHLGSTPPVIGAQRPDLSAFGPVFAKALAKKPADRYPSCRDFAAAMHQALAPVGTASGRHHRAAAPTGRRRWLAVGLGALVLLGAIAAAALTAGHRGPATSAPTTTTATAPPPPAVAARMDLPVVVLGADCAVLGAAAVTETGAPAYCARSVVAPDPAGLDPAGLDPAGLDPATPDSVGAETVWSPQPERLRTATPPTPAAP
jgi:serine/threonine-protein kinase